MLLRLGAVHGDHTCFLSHFKSESAAEARILKLALVRALGVADDEVSTLFKNETIGTKSLL